MTADQLAAAGAFLSGAGSVIGGWWVVRGVRKRARADCDRRVAELRMEYDRGLDRGLQMKDKNG